MQLSKMTDFRLLGQATTAGSSNFTTAECIDCADHQGAYFLLGCGSTYAAAITMAIYGSNTTGSFQALPGASAASAGGPAEVIVDVKNPKFRYLQPIVTASTAAEFMVFGTAYGKNVLPTTGRTYQTEVVGVGT